MSTRIDCVRTYIPGVALFIALLLALAGCGGGGGGNNPGASPGTTMPETEVSPALNPELIFDCSSTAPMKASDTNMFGAGIWRGELINCDTDTTFGAELWITDDGRFRILPYRLDKPSESYGLMRGLMTPDGDIFEGSGIYLQADEISSDLWIDGAVANRVVGGRWGAAWGGYGYFNFVYKISASGSRTTELMTGKWNWEEWSIDGDGQVTGQDTNGCHYDGQIAFAESGQPYDFDLSISGDLCTTAGNYSGLVYWSSGPFWDVLHVSVDNGDSKALAFELLDTDY